VLSYDASIMTADLLFPAERVKIATKGLAPGVMYSYRFGDFEDVPDPPRFLRTFVGGIWPPVPRVVYAGLKAQMLYSTFSRSARNDSVVARSAPHDFFPAPFIGISGGRPNYRWYIEVNSLVNVNTQDLTYVQQYVLTVGFSFLF
ncbi:MAG: hypothetical protein WBD36_12350, partial [Bacteroidota bacterium]